MPTIDSSQQVVATIIRNGDGTQTIEAGKPNPQGRTCTYITEAMLLQLNGFMRDKWDNVRDNLKAKHGGKSQPWTPEQFF